MKILFISALLPYPLHSGGQVRIYNLLKKAALKHEITLFSLIREETERKLLGKLNFCRKVEVFWRGRALRIPYLTRALLGKYSLLLSSYNNEPLRREIRRELLSQKYDLIHIEPSYVFPSLPNFKLPLVVAEHNIEYAVYRANAQNFWFSPAKPILLCDAAKLKYWEEKIWRRADHLIVVSEQDKRIIEKQVQQKPITVIANGVDFSNFICQTHKTVKSAPVFLFVGRFSWLPNLEAGLRLVKEIWPSLKKAYPQGRLRIVGQNLPVILKKQTQNNGIELAENIENISKEYQRADVFLAPMTISGGTKFKILEAMASGLAVVATREAIGGLQALPGQHYLEAGSAAEFVKQTREILQNEALRAKLVKSARNLIETKYNWETLGEKLLQVWQTAYEQKK